jgi:type I restriction enzyme S subunit
MMNNWQNTTLGEVLTFQRGFDITKSQQQDGPYAVISSSGPQSTHNEFMVNGPGVVIGRKGTLGSVFYSENPFWPHDTTLWIKDFHGNNPKFAYYFLQTLHLEQYDAGASNPSLNRNHIHLLPVKYPPIPTQRRIADILSAYDDLIENNTRRIRILEAIYQEWFGEFKFPNQNKTKKVQTEIGNVPEGWFRKFSDFVDFLEGPGLRRWQFREKGMPFLNIRTLIDNDIDLSKVQYVDEDEVAQRYSHFLLQPFDHVVSSSGTLGRISTVQEHHLPLMLNTSIIRMRPKTENIGRWQLKHFLQSDYFQKQILAHASGAAQPNYGPAHLKQMWIIAPTAEIGRQYEKIVEPMELLICSLVQKNTNLRQTRDLLLPRLVSGEIDVSSLS